MNRAQKTFILILALLFSLLTASCEVFEDESQGLQASGLVEANEVRVASELSGRVVSVQVEEGDRVQAGDTLFILDEALLQAERKTAQAAFASAQANTRLAETALDSARIQLQLTLDAALQDDQDRRVQAWQEDQPDDFDLPVWYFNRSEGLEAVRAEVETARQALASVESRLEEIESQVGSERFIQAEARLIQAQVAYRIAQEVLDRTNGVADGDRLRQAAEDILDDAEKELLDAQQAYDNALTSDGATEILEGRADVTIARERYDTTLDSLRRMQTGLNAPAIATAKKAVDQAQVSLEQAQAAVGQAQAQLDLLDIQIAKLTVKAPLEGVVLTLSIQPGEVIQAGAAALTIADLESLTVTVYIPEDRYGEVSLDDRARLSVDSFPNETFEAVVTRIADRAEFTPRNVQTKEERQTTVYAVELAVENPTSQLKPGMPVDVVFNP